MEGLEWRPAFKRAALFVALWLLTIYAFRIAFPESFSLGLDEPGGILNLLVTGILFFLFFTVITAFTERRKKRARQDARTQSKGKSPRVTATGTEDGEASGPGELKGRHNPNTSRKKASRRRRR
jgi:hypothetical protein